MICRIDFEMYFGFLTLEPKFRAQLPRKEETLKSVRKTVRYVLAVRVKLGSKEYIFQYLLSTIVLDFMGFPFHKKDKFDVEVTIEEG